MRILIDIDNTLCDNMGEWLRIYNKESGDTVSPDDIKIWDIESYIRPEYKTFFWEVAYPQSFWEAEPYPNARQVITDLMVDNHEIIYVTAGVCVEKMKWMYDLGFTEGKHYLAPKNIIIAFDKALVVGDLLVDDGLHNCYGRNSIIFDQPWNQNCDIFPRAHNWLDVKRLMVKWW